MRVSIKCACGRGRLKSNPTCDKCLMEVEMSQGGPYTSANFDLRDLSLRERQLVFLWACGQDISEYFDVKVDVAVDVDLVELDFVYGKVDIR